MLGSPSVTELLIAECESSLRLTKHHAMKAYCGSGGIAKLMEVSGLFHAPATLPPREGSPVSTE
jgi:hypothetical protein